MPPEDQVDAAALLTEVWNPTDAALSGVFARIATAAGPAGVHGLWRRLGSSPVFLTAVWPAVSTDLTSSELQDEAQALSKSSFIVEAVGLPSHKAFRGDLVRAEIDADFREKIERFNRLSQRSLSRLLIVAASLNEGASGRARETSRFRNAPSIDSTPDSFRVPPLRDEELRGKAREVLPRVAEGHALPWLDDYYRSLARIPEYLSAAWNAISPLVGDPVYLKRAAQISNRAARAGAALSGAQAAARAIEGTEPGNQHRIRATLDLFARLVLPQTLIDVTLITALTSGPAQATASAS